MEDQGNITQEKADLGPFAKTTIGEHGVRLIVGTGPFDGSMPRDTSLSLRPWYGGDERQIAAMRSATKMTPTRLVAAVLAHFVEKWGSHDFKDMTSEQRLNVILASASADVFHAWTLLRIENMGAKHTVQIGCGNCEKAIPYAIDLEEITVLAPHDPKTDIRHFVDLKNGVPFAGKHRMRPCVASIPWSAYERVHEKLSPNMSTVMLAIVEQSVIGFDDYEGRVALSAPIVDKMTRADINSIYDAVGGHTPGPDLSYRVTCPHCGAENLRAVAWEYDPFFSEAATSR